MAMLAMAAYAFFVVSLILTQLMFAAGLIALCIGSTRRPQHKTPDGNENSEDLPFISVLLPARDETESLKNNCAAFQQITYPRGMAELIILTDEKDIATTKLAESLAGKYSNVRSAAIPETFLGPKHTPNKPRALLYGLTQLDKKSSVVGVLDAEDLVSENLLLEAAKELGESPIVQGRLAVRNRRENLLTFWYASEYALLELLQRGRKLLGWMTFPRGSTYFVRKEKIEEFPWRSFSLTEDLWFNLRTYAAGNRTALIDTTTWEESPTTLGAWIRQRTRWFQGKLQIAEMMPKMSGLRLDQKVSVLHLVHGTLVTPLATILTLPFLIHDSVAGAIFAMVSPISASSSYTFLWAASLAGLALICLEFALATWITYRSQRGVCLRILACFLLPIEFVLLLPAAALRAYWRYFFGRNNWEKTPHRGETLCPLQPGEIR